ncbi:MAG: HPr family phosphocarrier protein [Nanoarchaeota archaeon]
MTNDHYGLPNRYRGRAYVLAPLIVESKRGLHARPSMELAYLFEERCKGAVFVSRTDKPEEQYDATSICQIMLLGAGNGATLQFSFDCPEDATPKLVEDLAWILQNGTGEGIV